MTILANLCLLTLILSFTVMGKSCEILENLSCQCHSSFNGDSEQLICSNYNTQIDSNIKLTNESRQMVRTFDSFHLTFYDQQINISAMFINDLSYLFPRYSPSSSIKGKSKSFIDIKLSFPNFVQLHFEDYAFYQLFGDRSDFITSLTLELTSNGQVTFSSMAFSQLKVDQMIVHSSSLEPYSFEEIFNHTTIADLSLEGFTPRSNDSFKAYFNGRIQNAKFTKMVEVVSNEEFPSYPVRSMIIEAHEARKLNASTFMNYRNLHGIHLIRPKFFFDNRSFDGFQYLANLETIELDAETIKDHTFQHVARIRNLILGSNIRYLSEHALENLDYLKNFDASKITLDQLHPTARCVLARYIDKQKKRNPSLNIVPPQAEYCDCVYDFILTRLNKKPDNFYINLCENNQQERCQLSECDVVKTFRLPSIPDENSALVPSVVETIVDPAVNANPIEEKQTMHSSPAYVHRHSTIINHKNQSIPMSHSDVQIIQTSELKVNEPFDPNAIPTNDEEEDLITGNDISKSASNKNQDEDELYRISMKNQMLKWFSLSLVCITILCILLVITLIWYFACYRKNRVGKAELKPLATAPTNV